MIFFLVIFGIIVGINIFGALISYIHLSTKNKTKNNCGESQFVILIPLLNEQAVINELLNDLLNLIESHNCIAILVTTKRESNTNKKESTMSMVDKFIKEKKAYNKIKRIHYNKVNKVVAEQVNYGISYIKKNFDSNTVIALYNADSKFNIESYSECHAIGKSKKKHIIQQSSFFVSNLPELLNQKKYLLAAFGIYQSSWTICHEIPRYLTNQYVSKLPFCIRLVHCVGHGLFVRLDSLNELGNLPITPYGGEDLAFGFIARTLNYEIQPLKNLENSQTPKNFKTLFKQLASWFMALLGYFEYYTLIKSKNNADKFRCITLTILGILDSFRWLFKGIILLCIAYYSIKKECFLIFSIIYFIYCWIPYFIVIIIWNKQSILTFPRVRNIDLVKTAFVYLIIPIIRSIPAFIGLYWMMNIKIRNIEFIKPKTER